jgi:hypothetical protein
VAAGEADAALDLFDALSGQGADAVACGAAMEAAASLGDWARCLLVFEVGWRLHGLLRTLARCVTGVRWLMFFLSILLRSVFCSLLMLGFFFLTPVPPDRRRSEGSAWSRRPTCKRSPCKRCAAAVRALPKIYMDMPH